jgi:hypothetical protein
MKPLIIYQKDHNSELVGSYSHYQPTFNIHQTFTYSPHGMYPTAQGDLGGRARPETQNGGSAERHCADSLARLASSECAADDKTFRKHDAHM